MKDTYTLDYECPNCGHQFSLTFKRHEPADVLSECPNCGLPAGRKSAKDPLPAPDQPTVYPSPTVPYPWPTVPVAPTYPWWQEHPTYEPYRGPWSNPYPGSPQVWC